MKTLRELNVEIIGGQIVQRAIVDEARGDEVVDAKRKTIVAKTINEGLIDDESVVLNDYKMNFDEKKLTHEGDVVVKMSAPYNAVIIDKDHEGLLVSSFCSIIRNINEIDKRYLVAFLNSNLAQNQLKESVTGSIMSILSNGKLYDLEIPVPSKEKQVEIGEYFEKTIKNRIIFQKILALEEKKLDALIRKVED